MGLNIRFFSGMFLEDTKLISLIEPLSKWERRSHYKSEKDFYRRP